MASLTETETLNALLQILEKDQCPWFREELSCAYDYLSDYHKRIQMINGPLTWNDLPKFIGEPVWFRYKNADDSQKHYGKHQGWIILDELCIKKAGRYVLDVYENLLPFDDFEFFRMKK